MPRIFSIGAVRLEAYHSLSVTNNNALTDVKNTVWLSIFLSCTKLGGFLM